jgi:transposase-like protein
MDAEQKKRLAWIRLYEKIGNAGIVCRRCGISRPTLRKWLRRYQTGGIEALSDYSRKPKHSPSQKVFSQQESLILAMRKNRQLDVCKITARCYQYTAIDDCTRWKVVALYPRRTALNTLNFLDQVMERMPFPIQRFQTDRGQEFFAYGVQERLMEWGIKFRPIKPASPHLWAPASRRVWQGRTDTAD